MRLKQNQVEFARVARGYFSDHDIQPLQRQIAEMDPSDSDYEGFIPKKTKLTSIVFRK